MLRDPESSLSVVVPFYDDLAEAYRQAEAVRNTQRKNFCCQAIVVQLDPSRLSATQVSNSGDIEVVRCKKYSGLPAAKNLGLQASAGELVLFLYPGVWPEEDAVARLADDLRRHPDWGAVAGRWNGRLGQAEKGYNIRKFPTFAALVFDVLFINKIFPCNRITRRYKMHDFDHSTLIEVQHANDCAFMCRRDLLCDLGGFDQAYQFGWFDQVEMCQSMARAGRPVYYDPDAIFSSAESAPLINRILARNYGDYYKDLALYVRRHCRPWQRRTFTVVMILGMAMRLAFARILPRSARVRLLQHYRSYVDDEYIQSMSAFYADFFRRRRHGRENKLKTLLPNARRRAEE